MEAYQYSATLPAAQIQQSFSPLEHVTRTIVTTEEAAFYLNRRPQTMRSIASTQPAGMPRPLKINGRLAWRVADIKAVLNGTFE